MTDREERLTEALWRIKRWADAYPLEVFPEMSEEYAARAHAVLTQAGMTMDRISAHAMRHVIKGVGRIASEALGEDADPEKARMRALLREITAFYADALLLRFPPEEQRSEQEQHAFDWYMDAVIQARALLGEGEESC